MHFVRQAPSLQHLAGVKIVAEVWNAMYSQHILTQIAKALNGVPVCDLLEVLEGAGGWKEVEEEACSKVSALVLPQPCKKLLFNFIKPLGLEIGNWCAYHCVGIGYRLFANILPQQFCWTMRGTIHYAKTAQLMAKDERVIVERRFEIACLNCLKDPALDLFQSMGEARMLDYVNAGSLRSVMKTYFYYFMLFVTRTFNLDRHRLKWYFPSMLLQSEASLKEWLFRDELRTANQTMFKYWFQGLNQRLNQD